MNPTSHLGSAAKLVGSEGRPIRLAVSAALLAALAGAVAIVGMAGARSTLEMRSRLPGDLTVAVRARALESVDAAAARAAEIIGRQRGVKTVETLDPAPLDDIAGNLAFGRPAPTGETRLIAVTLNNPDNVPDEPPLAGGLKAAGLDVAFDDHRNLAGPVEHALALGAAAVAGLEALILIGLASIIYSSAGGQGRRGWERFDLMRRLGARRAFVSRLIAARCWRTVFWSALAGLLLPVLVTGVMEASSGEVQTALLGLPLSLDPRDLVAAAPWPPVFALIAFVVAPLGARAGLRWEGRR